MSLWAAQSNDFRVGLEDTASQDLLSGLLNALTSVLSEEVLVRSLYPMLNGDFTDSYPSVFSHSSQNVVSAQMFGLEQLLLETSTESMTLDQIFRICLQTTPSTFFRILMPARNVWCCYSVHRMRHPVPTSAAEAEFTVVECINQLTNMIDYVEQVQSKLIGPV